MSVEFVYANGNVLDKPGGDLGRTLEFLDEQICEKDRILEHEKIGIFLLRSPFLPVSFEDIYCLMARVNEESGILANHIPNYYALMNTYCNTLNRSIFRDVGLRVYSAHSSRKILLPELLNESRYFVPSLVEKDLMGMPEKFFAAYVRLHHVHIADRRLAYEFSSTEKAILDHLIFDSRTGIDNDGFARMRQHRRGDKVAMIGGNSLSVNLYNMNEAARNVGVEMKLSRVPLGHGNRSRWFLKKLEIVG